MPREGRIIFMKVQEAKRQIRLREWAEQITKCKQSGLTVKEWCKIDGINIKTYYNRVKRVREELLDVMATGNADLVMGLAGLDRNRASKQQDLVKHTGKYTPPQLEQPVFAMLPTPKASVAAVTVHIGLHVAEIHNGADAQTMESALRALSRL